MYALVAAHLAHLLLNWRNDSFILRQRINCGTVKNLTKKQITHKPPQVLPASGLIRWFRLVAALLVLIVTLKLETCSSDSMEVCDTDVSHTSHNTHLFGALSGFMTGCLFLRARTFPKFCVKIKYLLLGVVYGSLICYMITKFYNETTKTGREICPWIEYERVCQDQCYRKICNTDLNCTVNLCKPCK